MDIPLVAARSVEEGAKSTGRELRRAGGAQAVQVDEHLRGLYARERGMMKVVVISL